MWKGVMAAVLSLTMAACTMLGLGEDDPLETGRVLFDSYKLETEWGYHLQGIYIDSAGLVWSYEHREPWFPSEQRATVVGEDDLLRKYDGAKRVGSVDPRVIEKMVTLIDGAARGRVSRETPSFERSGSLEVAYVYKPRAGNYHQVYLHGGGAWAARNFSTEARDLIEWLAEVKKTVGFDQ